MDAMRADMGGAATVCASVVTAAALKLPINIIGGFYNIVKLALGFINNLCVYFQIFFAFHIPGLAPLCENMPSGKATKPGDVVTAKNGKTIQVGKQLFTCETVGNFREKPDPFVCRLTTRMRKDGWFLLMLCATDTRSIPELLLMLLR